MRRTSEAVKADVRRRMGPPPSPERCRDLQGTGDPRDHPLQVAQGLAPAGGGGAGHPGGSRGLGASDKFTVVLETAGLNATELGGHCRERGLFPDQVDRWRQAAQDANAQPLLTMADQKDLQNATRRTSGRSNG